MAEYYKELTEHTGQNITTITDVEFLYNTLENEEQHGLELPAWTRKFYNNEMLDIAARSLAIFTDGTIQKRLRGGTAISLQKQRKISLRLQSLNCIVRSCIVKYIDISRSATERDFTVYGEE